MKKLISSLFLLLLTFLLSAQTNIDSLINVLDNSDLRGKEKFDLYNDICYYYSYSDPVKAKFYTQQALSFSQKEKEKLWISIFYSYLGQVYRDEGEYDKAQEYFDEALRIAIDGKIARQEAYIYMGMASLYQRQGRIHTALDLSIKALAIYEKEETPYGQTQQVNILSNIGSLYRGLDNSDHAVIYLIKAEELAEKLDYQPGIMTVCYDFGDIFRTKKEYDKAKSYALKSLDLSRLINNKIYQIANLSSLALIYAEGFKDHENAERSAKESLEIAKELNDPYVLFSAWRTLAEIYIIQGKFLESEEAGMIAWELDSTHMDQGAYVAHNLGLANIYLGNKEKAAYFFNKSVRMTRELSDKNIQSLMVDLEVKYETEKKDARIVGLEKARRLYVALGIAIVIVLLTLILLLFYRHRTNIQKRKIAEQQIKQLEQEKELIAARSALDAEKAEREFIARDLHDGVGAMLSVVKNNMDVMKSYSIVENTVVDHFNQALNVLDQSIVELRRIAHHIMPATLIEKGLAMALEDFCRSIPIVEFYVSDREFRFETEKELVLYRCTYELINNALRHSGASRIEVHLSRDEKMVYLSVVDDGCGFDTEKTSFGMGLNNMRSRLAAFGGRLEIYSTEGKGTEVNIDLDFS